MHGLCAFDLHWLWSIFYILTGFSDSSTACLSLSLMLTLLQTSSLSSVCLIWFLSSLLTSPQGRIIAPLLSILYHLSTLCGCRCCHIPLPHGVSQKSLKSERKRGCKEVFIWPNPVSWYQSLLVNVQHDRIFCHWWGFVLP